MDSTWEPRDLPVLDAVARLIDRDGPVPGAYLRDIAGETGLDIEDVVRATNALEAAGLIVMQQRTMGGNGGQWRVREVSGEARRLVGAWPTPDNLADRIVAALQDAADNAPTEEERSRARKLLDGATGVGKGVLTGVLVKVLSGEVG
jgi:hypothetical protein